MHHSDTLVLGPLPVVERSIRLPLAAVLIALVAVVLAGGVVVAVLARPRAIGLPLLAAQAVEPTPVAADDIKWLTSAPAGADLVLDGQVVGQTPVEVATARHTIVLRRPGAPDVRVLDPKDGVAVPVWRQSTVLPVRSPVPGGAITDVTLLRDGRASLIVASPSGLVERQAWILDPAGAEVVRIGSALRQDNPPAGVVVAPDGQHRVTLMRSTPATPNTRATADQLLVDGSEGTRPLLPERTLGGDERVSDVVWAPDGQSALLVTQRPIAGYPPNVSLSRLRQVPLTGTPRDVVDLPVAPLGGSWVWSADGRNLAFLVRTSPPTLAALDLSSGALRSVADLPSDLLPAVGAAAPAAWTTDGTLVFAAPQPEEPATAAPIPTAARSTARPSAAVRLQALSPGRTDPQVLGDTTVLPVAPATGLHGVLLALSRAADGTLLLHTLDARGHLVAEQSLGIQLAGALSVRWDLAHGELVLLQSAAAGGIDLRILRVNDAEAQP
jgi:PEGA domain